jgi:hypothetical protein
MADNKHEPAFPAVNNENSFYTPGVSKLEFFACNAPVDIPGWFTYSPPPDKPIEDATWLRIENVDDRKYFIEWLKDGDYDLPDHLKKFKEEYDNYHNDLDDWRKKDWAARYFQWRRYYAEQLLNELSNPQP